MEGHLLSLPGRAKVLKGTLTDSGEGSDGGSEGVSTTTTLHRVFGHVSRGETPDKRSLGLNPFNRRGNLYFTG